MKDQRKDHLRSAIALAASVSSSVALAAGWHQLGFALPYTSHGYSQYLRSCLSLPFVALWLLLGIALGFVTTTTWPVAIGMILPLPAAVILEVIDDPGSHNLLGFEVIIFWAPGLLLALVAAYFGGRIRERFTLHIT